MKNVSKSFIQNIEIPIPSITIQEQIVESLDVIYDTIEGNNKLIQNQEIGSNIALFPIFF